MSLADDFLAQAGVTSAPAPKSLDDQFTAQAAEAPDAPAATSGGGFGSELLRQLGLTTRAAVTGLTGIPVVVGNALNGAVNLGVDGYNALTDSNVGHLRMPGQVLEENLSKVLPDPKNAQERIVQDASSAGFGLAPTYKLGQALANSTQPAVNAISRTLTALPGNQAVAAASAGASGGGAREAGLGPGWQLAASIVGGAGGALASAGGGSLATKLKNTVVDQPTQPQLAPTAVESIMGDTPLPASPEAQAAITQRTASLLNNTPGADPTAAARAADAKQLGMTLTLGQQTRDPALFAQEQNWRGLPAGAPLLDKFRQQNIQLANALESTVGSGGEAYRDGQTVIDALQNIDNSMKSQVSAAYKAAEQSSGAKFDVPLAGVAQDYADVLHNFGDKVPSGVRNNFDSLGLMKGTQTKVFGIDDAENLLKVINANHSNDPATNAALQQLSQSVKNAVLQADDQGGVFAGPRQMAAQRFQLHDQVPALADASKSAIAPEDFTRKYLMNGDVDQVKGLVNLLGTSSPQALKAVQGQVGNELQRAAFGENLAGDKVFAPERYAKALRNFGGSEKLSAVYGPQAVDDLYGIGRVGSYINSEPAFSPVNRSNTGSAVLDMASEIPVVGKGITALAKRQMIARALNGNLGDTGATALPPGQAGQSLLYNAVKPANTQQDQ